LLLEEIGLDLRRLLYPESIRTETSSQLDTTEITQPVLFAVEYAMAKMLMEWGVHPKAMIGHSVGEYVAACLAGVFTLEAALHLVAQRGRLISKLPRGAMLSVSLSEPELNKHVGRSLSLAAVNGPSACVVSGPASDIDRLRQELAD